MATALISALDTYYTFVQSQMAILGANVTLSGVTTAQPFGGVVDARDWPQSKPVEGALYLLSLAAVPTKQGTAAQREYEYHCQWVWIVIGDDIGNAQQGQNRGSRYRTHMQIMENLNQANYPGFCRKMDFSADVVGTVTSLPSKSDYPVSDWESIRWSDPKFMPRSDQASGLIYGAAAVELYAFSDVSALLA